jgi:hypothetical protein
MCISNTSSCAAWEAYATTKAWTLTTGDGTKTVYAWYKDAAGNSSTSYTDTIVLDMTAPPVPSGLTAAAVSSSQINLSWSAVVDTTGGSGLAGYKVYRNVTQIGTTASATYSDYGLTANTQYCYKVTAYDNIGNESGQCTQACTTTQSGTQPGSHVWSERFGSTSTDRGRSVAVDNGGNIVTAGSFKGAVDFGGGLLSSIQSSADGFVVKHSASGTYQWSMKMGGSGSDAVNAVVTDISNNVIIAGMTGSTTMDFNGTQQATVGGGDIFLAKYSSSGNYIWSKILGGSGYDYPNGVAVDSSNGDIVITGYFQGTVDFGGGPLTSVGTYDIYIAKYSASGAHLWSKRFGYNGTNASGTAIAVDAYGNVIVVGQFQCYVDLGGGLINSAGATDIFLAKYTASGTHIWSKQIGRTCDEYATAIAVDVSGNIFMTGSFDTTTDLGGGRVDAVGYNIFLAKYSSAGAYLWGKHFGGSLDASCSDYGRDVAVDSNGNVIMVGDFNGIVDFGGGALSSLYCDMFIAKYKGSGDYLWANSFGDMGNQLSTSVAVNGNGNIAVTGYFQNQIDFGGELFISVGYDDIFLATFTP